MTLPASRDIRWTIRLVTMMTAAVFFLSAILNFGAKIPVGFAVLGFSMPLTSTGTIETVIGLVLLAGAAVSRPYVYGCAYVLALVGITFGLLSAQVQGLARDLHYVMVPLAIGGCTLLAAEARNTYRSRAYRTVGKLGRGVIVALQFFVGGLVVVGGVEFARNGTYPLGTGARPDPSGGRIRRPVRGLCRGQKEGLVARVPCRCKQRDHRL